MCYQELTVMANLRTPEWWIQCEKDYLMVSQVVGLRDIHW